MDAGVASLLGALVGGGASFAATAYAERSERRRETLSERRAADRRAVVAARIVLGDLEWAEARVSQALENGKYWSVRYRLRADSWEKYREEIAESLDVEQWSCVHDAFRTVATLELNAGRRRSDNPLSQPALNDFGRARAENGLVRIRAAQAVLEPVARRRSRTEPIEEE